MSISSGDSVFPLVREGGTNSSLVYYRTIALSIWAYIYATHSASCTRRATETRGARKHSSIFGRVRES